MREDIDLKPWAEELGFEAVVDSKGEWQPGIPNNPYSFRHGKMCVWLCRKGWGVAKFDPEQNKFINHRYYSNLKTALFRAYYRYVGDSKAGFILEVNDAKSNQ